MSQGENLNMVCTNSVIDVSLVQDLINNGACVGVQDEYGNTPLHAVALNSAGHPSSLKVAEKLLSKGANLNAKNVFGSTPLHWAALRGEMELIKFFMNQEPEAADLNVVDVKGWSPLMWAIASDNVEVVQYFINIGANLRGVNPVSSDPVIFAYANNGSVEMIELLLKNGASANVPDGSGDTILLYHVFEGCRDNTITFFNKNMILLQLLLDHSDINVHNSSGKNVLSVERLDKCFWTIIIRHIAKVQEIGISIHPNILRIISSSQEYSDFFQKCKQELLIAKNTRLGESIITYFDLLTHDYASLVMYIENQILAEDIIKNMSNLLTIYEEPIRDRMKKAVSEKKVWKKTENYSSSYRTIPKPEHSINKEDHDPLSTEKLSKLII